MRANADTRVVNFDWNEMTKQMRIGVDQEKARQLGISSEQVSRALNRRACRAARSRSSATTSISSTCRAAPRRAIVATCRGCAIWRSAWPRGNSVPLAQIATFEYGLEETDDLAPRPPAHDHGAVEGHRRVHGRNRRPSNSQKPLEALMAKLPPGYRIEVGGAVGESAKGSASIMAVVPVMFLSCCSSSCCSFTARRSCCW